MGKDFVRENSRAVVLNDKNEIYLFKFHFAMLKHNKTLWVTPGGGLDADETYEECIKREIYEELGLEDVEIGEYVWYRNIWFETTEGNSVLSKERYFVVHVGSIDFSFEHMTKYEKPLTKAGRWWSVEDISSSKEEFFIDNLPMRLKELMTSCDTVYPIEI